MLKKLRKIWRFAVRIWRDEPVRYWRRNAKGEFCCDGDCGSYSMHGICTCGISHILLSDSTYTQEDTNRKRSSWMREEETLRVMRNIPIQRDCRHKIDLDTFCAKCEEEWVKFRPYAIAQMALEEARSAIIRP